MAVTCTIRCVAICLVLVMFGCAAGISGQARSRITYKGTFAALQKAPEKQTGQIVMLGGRVIETKGSSTFSEITVLQLPLDTRNRPQDGDQSEGRFTIRTGQFLDPAIYQAGSLITVVGRIAGSDVRPIGGFQYVYPVVEAIEIKSWPAKGRESSSLHFSIGVGTWF
jgi:outer membrane lipoprotein